MPVNIRLAPAELAHVRDDSGAAAAIVHTDQVESRSARRSGDLDVILEIGGSTIGSVDYEDALRARAATSTPRRLARHRDDIHFLLYTSGTTGRPKGVVNVQRGMHRPGARHHDGHRGQPQTT